MDSAALALNLSYVLHVPSTSSQVADAIRLMAREHRRLGKATAGLGRLPGERLLAQTIVANPTPGLHPEPGDGLISVQLGAWPLLTGLFQHLSGGQVGPVCFLDNEACPALKQTAPFFRAPAALYLPEGQPARWWFASLVVRPGGRGLLLEMTALPHGGGPADTLRTAVPLAESVIRAHTPQWDCRRPLWSRPAEQELPEFLALQGS